MGSCETLETGTRMRQSFFQNVIVMRHGDRLDNFNPLWVMQTARPWDPPLTDLGVERAFSTGRKLRNELAFSLTRAFVSPFFRCVQTVAQAVSALASVDDKSVKTAADLVSIDSSKIKVSIEYGLCEMLNHIAIPLPAKGDNWGFDISMLESILPSGTLDSTVGKLYEALPNWGEKVLDARARYTDVILTLATNYPSENLLLVTHGEGVGASVSAFKKGITVCSVDYCAYSHLRRSVSIEEDGSFTFGEFDVVTQPGGSGISYIS